MAIDSRISLAGTPLNIGQRFGQTLQNLQNLDLLNTRRDMAPLQQQQAQMQVDLLAAQQPAQLQAAQRAASGQTQALLNQDQRNQLDLAQAQELMPVLSSGNAQAVISKLNEQKQNAIKFNLADDVAEIEQAIQLAQTAEGLQQIISATTAAITQGQPQAKQFALKSNAPITDPTTGQVSLPTFDPNTNQTSLVPIPGAIQETPTQIANREQESAKKAADLEVKTTERKEIIKQRVARASAKKKEFSERRVQAARSKRKIAEAQKLAEKATQGLAGATKVQLGRVFPGIDTGNETALAGAFKTLALDELQKFNGPTTDFELRVTEDIVGSLGDGASANKARLSSLERASWFADRESNQFNEHIKAGHDPDEFFFNFNELITPKNGGKSYSLQSLQDTAVANHISIDEVIKRLAR